ncbi:MAG: penicillin-binding protein activator [Proteobacteria bacterium]|nr:penicillin-binding protein activator [Pseudomonadota bacterium]MBS0572641.1 penicillin-binding protein activator [Pseudomonadota bacterium]
MVSVFPLCRKAAKSAALAAALVLFGCGPMPNGGSGPAFDRSKPVPVALLLPSGSGNAGDETLARGLKQAADMAVADVAGSVKIDLRVYNAGSDPTLAAQMATQAADEGAVIILGPVFGDSANAAGLAVRGKGLNVLSFSNNTDVAGGNVFVLGQTFQNTARRLTAYAARAGKGNILIVHDKTPQGDLGQRAIETAAASTGARIVGTVPYDFTGPGVTAAVPTIVSTAQSTGASSMMLTADSAGALPLLAQLLPEQGLGPSAIQYIGLTRWDIPSATLALPGLQGGWFALPDPGLSAQFQSRYAAAYGQSPHPIAGLAYDGIAAVAALVKSGRSDPFSAASLTQPAGFAGVNGVFRLRPDGTNERGLAVAQIQNGQVVVIDPAPRSFGGAGF